MPINVLIALLFGLEGAVVGSFLNVVIDRIPRGRGVGGRSVCDGCGRKLHPKELIPVVSYIIQRGRSSCCDVKLSRQYPLIEIVSALTLFMIAYTHTTHTPLNTQSIAEVIALAAIASVSIAITVIDQRHHIIPDVLQLALLVGVLLSHVVSSTLTVRVVGEGLVVALPILLLYLVTRGRGMGFGDVKIQATLGLWLGVELGLLGLYVAFVLGAVYGVALMLMHKANRKSQIAFGPFLLIGAWVSYVGGAQIIQLARFLLRI